MALYKMQQKTDANGTVVDVDIEAARAIADEDGNNIKTTYATKTEVINVVANPTLAGGEANLTSLQVGNTKYAIQSSTPTEFLHHITVTGPKHYFSFIYKSTSPDKLDTFTKLVNGLPSGEVDYPCSGWSMYRGTSYPNYKAPLYQVRQYNRQRLIVCYAIVDSSRYYYETRDNLYTADVTTITDDVSACIN